MDLSCGALLVLFKQRLGTEHENRLNVLLCATLIVHFLYDEVIQNEFLLARLHNTLYKATRFSAQNGYMVLKRTFRGVLDHQLED